MKVLFAVNNENISDSIIKLYQKEYREIISGKNVYYFNAIIKELQRDQTYDRVIISEDLEPFSNNNLDIINKFLFEQLDKISDEAISNGGSDIPIIFIATDRRSKSDNLLSKLFSIGIYDALLGSDRSVPEVCKLLNKPRTKKEAKAYYKIETDDVSYQAESEDSVSETEIQNILTHYKKLGKNTERYVDSFNNIAAQYTDAQLRIITKFLPIGVKAVLEAESPKYQSIMTFGEGTYKRAGDREEKKNNLKIGFIETNSSKDKPTKPVVIPSVVNKDKAQKLTRKQEQEEPLRKIINVPQTVASNDAFSDILDDINYEKKYNEAENNQVKKETESLIQTREETTVQSAKRGRGRPRKVPVEQIEEGTPKVEPVKRGRGRPRKTLAKPIKEAETFVDRKEDILPGFGQQDDNTSLSGFDEIDNKLPGFDEIEQNTLPGFSNIFGHKEENEENHIDNVNHPAQNTDLSRLLSRDKKVVAFVGTSKARNVILSK